MTLHVFSALLAAVLLPAVAGAQGELPAAAGRQLDRLVALNPVYQRGHTGFALYDLQTGQSLYEYQADRLFVPASNLKLVTFYVARAVLGNRAPAIVYEDLGDEVAAWGTGYPLLRHPRFAEEDRLLPWLRAVKKPLRFHFPTEEGAVARYGAGWSWDDWNHGYVYERGALPAYGNRLFFDLAPADSTGQTRLIGSPPSVANGLRRDPAQKRTITRSEFGNDFTVGPDFPESRTFPLERALRLNPRLLINELQTELPDLSIRLGERDYPGPEAGRLTVPLPDTVYRRMLLQSDNFLAEQLLLLAATERYGLPDEQSMLAYINDTLLPPLGVEEARYADASGLSRYSLFSPRHMVRVVQALTQQVGRDRLLSFLPAGGKRGTLARRFQDAPETYVWAKTGSLSGVICLSGILKTKRGRWLAFSYMHNNFTARPSAYFREMEKTLGYLYERL